MEKLYTRIVKAHNIRTLPPTEDLLKVAQLNAQKLALLLYISTIPDEVKESIIALLPEMTIEQINEFLNILESRYLDDQTKDIDEEYQEKLKELVLDFEKKTWDRSAIPQKVADFDRRCFKQAIQNAVDSRLKTAGEHARA